MRRILDVVAHAADIPTDACLIWSDRWQGGRPMIQRRGKREYVYRLVFEAMHGYLPVVVRHSCDNGLCFNPHHLLGGTQADNVQDMIDRGRARKAQGEAASKAKLTWTDVRTIRNELEAGVTPAELARRYGVVHKTIRQIRDGRHWRAEPSG
jgi:DNA-binding transcriptional regulator YiaG